jgi:uncharacterized protein (DUF433 family)
MNHHDRIVRDPAISGGQPVVRGTRVLVRVILANLAQGESTESILANYPSVTADDVRAVIAFAAASAIEDLPAPSPVPGTFNDKSQPRVTVLEIACEGGGFDLEAVLDERGNARAFFTSTGGPNGHDDFFGEEPSATVDHGPMSWSEVLERHLRPNNWLEFYPQRVHPSIAALVRKELALASADGKARWSSALAQTFRQDVFNAYKREHCIHPHIGELFASGAPGALRLMAIGINAYVSEADWPSVRPDDHADWFRDGRYPFHREVARDTEFIARALLAEAEPFSGLTYQGTANIFQTNAVKVYVRESEGKRSDQLDRAHFEPHVATWLAELDLMAQHGLLPHVITVFGRPFWEWAWQAFHPRFRPTFKHMAVHSFTTAAGEGKHFANRIEVETASGKQTIALLAVRHPSARSNSKGQPQWLVAQPDVRALLGVAALG